MSELTTNVIAAEHARSELREADSVRGPQPNVTSGRRLSRPVVNLLLDGGLMLTFALLVLVSVVLQFVFPPGIAARGWLLWSLNHSQWCDLQFGILCVLILEIVVHVMLHWTWVCGVVVRQLMKKSELPDDGIRTLSGVGLLIGLLMIGAGVTGAAMLSIRMPVVPIRILEQ